MHPCQTWEFFGGGVTFAFPLRLIGVRERREVHDGPCKTSEERRQRGLHPDDALDAIQDTILACWENLPSLQKDRYFKTWLVRILLNKCADIQRRQSHYAFVEELPESAEEPDWDTRVDVRRAMAKLGDQDQLILSLFYYDDFSVRQIAEALSLSEGAVRTRLTRSRDRFKKSYLQEKGECL